MQLNTLIGANVFVVALLFAGDFVAGSPGSDPAAIYKQKCASCHGNAGGGDGPAAVAFDPRPTDFTDSTFQASRTDEQLSEAIASGSGVMPGFAAQLTPEELRGMVAYIRELGGQGESGRGREIQW